jgi:hypothetical protein
VRVSRSSTWRCAVKAPAVGGEQGGAGEVHAGTGCRGAEEGGAGKPPVQQCFVGADGDESFDGGPAVRKRRGQCGQQHDKDVAVAGFVAEAGGAVVVVEVLGHVGLYAFGAEGTGRETSRWPNASGERFVGHASAEVVGDGLGEVGTRDPRVLSHGDRAGDVGAIEQGSGDVGVVQVRRPGDREVRGRRVAQHSLGAYDVEDRRQKQVLREVRGRRVAQHSLCDRPVPVPLPVGTWRVRRTGKPNPSRSSLGDQ